MMRTMRQGTSLRQGTSFDFHFPLTRKASVAGASLLGSALLVCACGGGQKDANSAGTCPEGTVLQGSDCVPEGTASGDAPSKPKAAPKTADEDSFGSSSASSNASSASAGETPSGKGGYDKELVEAELKRSGRQVKSSCGAATDDEGKATGPWGKVMATITLGRNGHVKDVKLPSSYDGKPAGTCIVHAFQKVQFPPYAAPADATVDWEVEVMPPKH
jgi:hypothetical protein